MRDYEVAIANALREEGYTAMVETVTKANGIIKNVVMVKTPDQRLGITIYTDEMYDANMPVEEAIKKCKKMYEENKNVNLSDAEGILDYDGYVKSHVVCRLYHMSTPAEVKKSAKRYGFDDLILVPYVNFGVGAVKVKRDFLEKWNVTESTLFKDAMRNTKANVEQISILQFMADRMGVSVDEMFGPSAAEMCSQYIITNKEKNCGAAAIIGKIKELKQRYDGGFYVIPSSIHEVIVVPKTGEMKDSDLEEMIGIVNSSEVIPEEVLGHKPYYFE